ncbi:hypothetical protein CEXT_12181 [Caerostris extrusa]|uniref:Uncharacterized protein n=1 Tax=Caerostris extrusa TaxID=172846 RepID=A0AAV4SJ04_CAEEX|nr:hypothetical protein CEXT_12181 [Caerostris extrusa]
MDLTTLPSVHTREVRERERERGVSFLTRAGRGHRIAGRHAGIVQTHGKPGRRCQMNSLRAEVTGCEDGWWKGLKDLASL